MRYLIGWLGALLFLLALGGCSFSTGGGESGESGGSAEANSGETTVGEGVSGAVIGLEEARGAVVYIEAQGGEFFEQFRGFGETNPGRGSGFVIDGERGLAVTNNHVVTGAAYLEVYLDGEEEPYDARVLGASECSDLALIEIQADRELPFLEWREEEVEAGLEVSAAGYPADDEEAGSRPDYTLSRGIVNSVEADGETNWASVDSVIEHDALIRGGNSGGPLLDESGRVVGINYAAGIDPETGDPTGVQLAIGREEAQGLIDRLQDGDVDSIGINGNAYTNFEDTSGIDVYSVKTGSPAAEVGLEGAVVDEEGNLSDFDSITELEGSRLGENGTMEEYCRIIGQREPDEQISITVDRYRDGALDSTLEGVLNGGENGRLEVVESASSDSQGSGGESTPGYTLLTDATETLQVEVPESWSDTTGGPWAQEELGGEELGPSIVAAPDIQGFNDSYDVPGVFFAASSSILEQFPDDPANAILDEDFLDFSSDCEYEGRTEYDDGIYVGQQDTYTNCGGTEAEQVNIVAQPEDGSYAVLVQVTIPDEEAREAADKIYETFVVTEVP